MMKQWAGWSVLVVSGVVLSGCPKLEFETPEVPEGQANDNGGSSMNGSCTGPGCGSFAGNGSFDGQQAPESMSGERSDSGSSYPMGQYPGQQPPMDGAPMNGGMYPQPINGGDGSAADALFAANEKLNLSLCKCLGDDDYDSCTSTDSATRDCELATMRMHSAGAAMWLQCVAGYFGEQQKCIDAAVCDASTLGQCDIVARALDATGWELVEVPCGPMPAPLEYDLNRCVPGGETFPMGSICHDGSNPSAVPCDHVPQCNDGSDELNCGPDGEGPLPGMCADGSGHFEMWQHCDGTNQCADGSDETSCAPEPPCHVAPEAMCDGFQDCNDGSDEAHCDAEPSFPCDSGEEIAVVLICNGQSDCEDGSDELPVLCD